MLRAEGLMEKEDIKRLAITGAFQSAKRPALEWVGRTRPVWRAIAARLLWVLALVGVVTLWKRFG